MRKGAIKNHPTLPFEEWDELALTEADLEADGEKESRLYFMSFGSGSSGNSCYVGTSTAGVIIDAGVRADKIEDALKANGIPMSRVKGLLLTHDHSDHVRYCYNLLRNNRHIPLYCTPRVMQGLLRRHNVSRRITDYHTPIYKEFPFKVGEMEITAFDVPHDGSDNMGFSIEFANHIFALATDLGEINDRARHYLQRANYIVLEANYDSEMLRLGRYPEYLKARIRTSNGHLDNIDTARFLGECVASHTSHVFLCHLSKDNNTPAKALNASREVLKARGLKVGSATMTISDRYADVQLTALPRFEPTRLYVFKNQSIKHTSLSNNQEK